MEWSVHEHKHKTKQQKITELSTQIVHGTVQRLCVYVDCKCLIK